MSGLRTVPKVGKMALVLTQWTYHKKKVYLKIQPKAIGNISKPTWRTAGLHLPWTWGSLSFRDTLEPFNLHFYPQWGTLLKEDPFAISVSTRCHDTWIWTWGDECQVGMEIPLLTVLGFYGEKVEQWTCYRAAGHTGPKYATLPWGLFWIKENSKEADPAHPSPICLEAGHTFVKLSPPLSTRKDRRESLETPPDPNQHQRQCQSHQHN